MNKNEKLPACPKNGPFNVMLLANKPYMWCSCGLSETQPYCDGSHNGTDFLPTRIICDEASYLKLCGCKKTNNPPYCDNSHLS